MSQRHIMESSSVLLILFLHTWLIPSTLSLGGWLLSVFWVYLLLLALPSLFRQFDRYRLNREVSAALVLLFGLSLSITFVVIERAVGYHLAASDVQRVVLFIFLGTLVGRIEAVYGYHTQRMPQLIRMSILVVVVLSTLWLIRYSSVHLLPMLNSYGWVEAGDWAFWFGSAGKLLQLIFLLLLWRWLIRMAYMHYVDKKGAKS